MKPLFRAAFEDGTEGDVLLMVVRKDDGALVTRVFEDVQLSNGPARPPRRRRRKAAR